MLIIFIRRPLSSAAFEGNYTIIAFLFYFFTGSIAFTISGIDFDFKTASAISQVSLNFKLINSSLVDRVYDQQVLRSENCKRSNIWKEGFHGSCHDRNRRNCSAFICTSPYSLQFAIFDHEWSSIRFSLIWNVIIFCVGMVWSVIFGVLEGRKDTELLVLGMR